MKLISFNIRGAGSKVKRKKVREMLNFHKVDFCCIQESKLEKVDQLISRSLWGSGNFGWVAKASTRRSGGMISIWDAEKFVKSSFWDFDGELVVKGC